MRVSFLFLAGALLLPACTAAPDAGGTSPSADARACRTALDCDPGEVCSVEEDATICRAARADEALIAPGPAGQPPPPVGLLEGRGMRRARGGDR